MFSNLVASPSELSLMTKVLNEYCSANNVLGGLDRDTVAQRIVLMFSGGMATEAELMAGLTGRTNASAPAA